MPITINYVRENESDKTVFFKLDYNDETVDWHADIPLDKDPQVYLEAMEDNLVFLILNKIYPEAQWRRFKTEENNQREAMESWIEDGHRNIVGYEDEEEQIPIYEVITNHPYHGTHPPQFDWIEMIENASSIPDLKEVLIDIFKEQI